MLLPSLRICSRLVSFTLVVFLSSCIAICSAVCGEYPISAPIDAVKLSNGATMRGISLSVGTPAQNMAFLPQWPINNTYVYDQQGQCNQDWSADACITLHGGIYDANSSQTHVTADSKVAAFDSTPNITSAALWAKDSLALNSNLTLGNFPLGIPRTNWGGFYLPQMILGLGPNSTVLGALKAAGKVSSRSWSFFWGLTGSTPNVQMPGNFVFGGYDRAKVTGANHTQSLSFVKLACASGMLVEIVDMQLNFPNGSSPSIFSETSQSTALSACLRPDYPMLMTLPYESPYSKYFQKVTGGTGIGISFGVNLYGTLYAPDNVYEGDLTVSFDSGLSIRIPNSVLVNPDLYINKTSGALMTNNSAPELLIDSEADGLPMIGRQFFSAAYVMLNQDSNSFTLWKANPTTDTDLVAVDENNAPVAQWCSGNTTQMPTNMTIASPPSKKSGDDLSGGAIAGIVVGTVVGVGLLVGAALFFLHWRRRWMTTRAAVRHSYEVPPPYHPAIEDNNKYDQPSFEPQEMEVGPTPPPLTGVTIPRKAVPGIFELQSGNP